MAVFSGYSPLPPPGAYVDSRVAAMLTPIGLVTNLVVGYVPEGERDLRPYYDQPMSRGGMLEHPILLAAYLLTLLSAIGLLRAWRPFR